MKQPSQDSPRAITQSHDRQSIDLHKSKNSIKRKKSKVVMESDEDSSNDEHMSKRSKPGISKTSPHQSRSSTLSQQHKVSRDPESDRRSKKVVQPSSQSSASDLKNSLDPDKDTTSSSDDEPLKASIPASTSSRKRKIPAKTRTSPESTDLAEADSSEDEKPLKQRIAVPAVTSADSSSDDTPLKKATKTVSKEEKPKIKVKKVPAKETSKVAKKIDGKKTKATIKSEGNEDDETEEQYRWWEHEPEDHSVKWITLEHNGVVFPEPYLRLPKDVRMNYNSRPLDLTAEAEEVAGFFGALIETDHARNPVFVKNFFEDFQKVCKESGMAADKIPKEFQKCDFRPMWTYFESKKEEKKSMTKDEKKQIKQEKDAIEEKYKEAIVDGRREKIGNFRIEPPGLFRGRGAHPKTGRLKTRVQPEQITINIGENVPVPAPPEGHKWAEVRHDNTVTWLATWNENINNNVKYVMMAAGSSFKGQSDLKKYEKARTLKGCIRQIRQNYEKDLSDKVMETRQRATAMYFIDKFALRAGNEKGEDEADTVGCCSLRLEHVSLKEPQTVIFDFLGKDSIRYYNEVVVDKRVFKNIMIFKKGKAMEDMIFDRLNTGKLNKHLTELMPGLSAKVFRTFNASFTFQEQLKQTEANASVADKVLAYNRANREVAILCNHQRTVSKTHDVAMEKIEDKVKEQKYQKMRLRRAILDIDPKLSKARPELIMYESDVDDEWIASHHAVLYTREIEKIKKKFERENEKLLANGETAMPNTELDDRLKVAEELKVMLEQEKISGKVIAKSGQTIEKLEAQITKLEERIAVTKTQMIDKDENKATALGTSKINYIDPRLTFAWCAKHSVPIEKMFTKTLREKFQWAADTPADWVF